MARTKKSDYYNDFLQDLRTCVTYTLADLEAMERNVLSAFARAKERAMERTKEKAIQELSVMLPEIREAIYEELKKKYEKK